MSAAMPVMRARGLRKVYSVGGGLFKPARAVHALDDIAFTLQPGRTLAVVGESGCGKSTLARQLTLIESPSSGSVEIRGKDSASASDTERKQLRTAVQMVFQNPFASLNPRKTIAQALEEPLLVNTSQDRASRQERIRLMIEKVGLRPEHVSRYPHMFSGGQRQRIAIARAMMLDPAVVVADEPVSALDVSIQAQILNLFMDLQEQSGTAYVFISHNLPVVEHIADDILVMYLGRAVEQGDKRRIFAKPLHPYTRALIGMSPTFDVKRRAQRIPITGELPSPLDPPAGCAFHPRCPLATARCKSEAPELREIDGRDVACHAVC